MGAFQEKPPDRLPKTYYDDVELECAEQDFQAWCMKQSLEEHKEDVGAFQEKPKDHFKTCYGAEQMNSELKRAEQEYQLRLSESCLKACCVEHDLQIHIRHKINKEHLEYINSGIPNVVYEDTENNMVVKFAKGPQKDEESLKNKVDLKNQDNIMSTLPSQINRTDLYKYNELEFIKYYVDKAQNVSNIIKDLNSILQIEFYSVYPEIKSEFGGICCHSQTFRKYNFEYLTSHNIRNIKFLQIIEDLKELNLREFIHGDLQNNCNNIEYIMKIDEFKIIDVESIRAIFIDEYISIRQIYEQEFFIDFKGIQHCLTNRNIEINTDVFSNYNYSLFMQIT